MKLRTWLFLALFFSSFSIFAGTRAEAQAACEWFISPYQGFSCGKHPDNDAICVMTDQGQPMNNYCWAYTPDLPPTCEPPLVLNPDTNACEQPASCSLPRVSDPANPTKCIPSNPAECPPGQVPAPGYPDPPNCITPECPEGQVMDPITHSCKSSCPDGQNYCSLSKMCLPANNLCICLPPLVINSTGDACELPPPPCNPPMVQNGDKCEMPDCPPPGAWNYTLKKCEGSPPPPECNPPKVINQYGNCVDPSNPPPPPPPPPPPGTPGHDGNGSGTGTNSDGSSSKFDFKIDLSGLEKNTADAAKEAKRGADAMAGIGDSLEAPTHGLGGLDVPGREFSGRTYTELLNNFTTKLQSAPFVNSVNQFFNISVSGGSCPTWTANAWVFNIVIDAQCSASMQNVWPIIRGVMILIFSVLAFRTAFL